MLALCSHSLQEMKHRQSGKGQLMTANCWIHSQSFFLLSPPGYKYALGYKRQLLSVECLRGKNILCIPVRLRRETNLFSHIKQGKQGGTCASSVLPHRASQERWNKLPKIRRSVPPTVGWREEEVLYWKLIDTVIYKRPQGKDILINTCRRSNMRG